MTTIRNTPHALSVLALACVLAACSDKPAPQASAPAAPVSASAPDSAAAPTAAAAATQPQDNAQADASDKLQAYIGCYNRIDGSAHRSLARYASWVKSMDAGPTGKEKVIYGLYDIGADDIANCNQAITEAAAQKPVLDKLDAAARNYLAALEALGKTVALAYPYYDRENYKDDQFAKGKELHKALVQDGRAFQAASDAFSKELDLENDKLLAAELAAVEKAEGKKLTYWRMSLMAQAKQLAALVGEETFSAEAAAGKLAAFEATTDEAMKYGAAHKAELPTAWFTIEQAAENYRKAAKQRVRRIRDKVPYNDGEKMMLKPGSAWMVEGSTEQVIKAYNDLVQASNGLH